MAAAERAWVSGAAILPLDPGAPRPVVDRLLGTLRPHVLVDTGGEQVVDADAPPVAPGVEVVIATSGSSGVPKGAELTGVALSASAAATAARIGVADGDRWLSCLPWQHIGGLQVLLRARAAGVPLVVHPSFEVAAVARADATLVSLVPTQLRRLLDAGVDLSRFRAVLLGGAAAPPALLTRAGANGVSVVTTYGMSETCGGCVYDGRPLDGVEVTVDDTGRIRLRGPVLMAGYRLRSDLSAAAVVDGWLRTEDLGSWDDGRLVVHGRADDVIVTGGENVVAGRVADVLAGHPDVDDVAVTAVADEEWGQRVVAVVVARDRAPSLAELRGWVAERSGAPSAPRQLVVVDRIPRLASGKPDRLAVDALARERSGQGRGSGISQSADPPSTT